MVPVVTLDPMVLACWQCQCLIWHCFYLLHWVGMASCAQSYDEIGINIYTHLSEHLVTLGLFLDGKHANMNSQQPNKGQQPSGNGCNHSGSNPNYKSQHLDGPATHTVPIPISDPTIQYTKVSCNNQSKVKTIRTQPNMTMIYNWTPSSLFFVLGKQLVHGKFEIPHSLTIIHSEIGDPELLWLWQIYILLFFILLVLSMSLCAGKSLYRKVIAVICIK